MSLYTLLNSADCHFLPLVYAFPYYLSKKDVSWPPLSSSLFPSPNASSVSPYSATPPPPTSLYTVGKPQVSFFTFIELTPGQKCACHSLPCCIYAYICVSVCENSIKVNEMRTFGKLRSQTWIWNEPACFWMVTQGGSSGGINNTWCRRESWSRIPWADHVNLAAAEAYGKETPSLIHTLYMI